uniref:GH18 domain-containing protein n=2 Tax=Chrysotila carterae TaxID=13221 RepID=A0A7S4ESA0_CHRCT|mmetsp:Transcript_9796/g.20920  ORF Transcript_9796/g.20920 Transcript_9796/m.20920 type:complete len:159 (-) Transcript_9796:201-677(-)
MHMMAYDQGGRHSTFELADASARQGAQLLPPQKLTLGLPFYARKISTGEWKSYEDLLKSPSVLEQPDSDEVDGWYYNSRAMLRRKTELALALGLQGVMIWEAGQDCRVNEVRRGGNVHVQTCPGGSSHSLLHAISEAVEAAADSRRGVPGDAKTREEL